MHGNVQVAIDWDVLIRESENNIIRAFVTQDGHGTKIVAHKRKYAWVTPDNTLAAQFSGGGARNSKRMRLVFRGKTSEKTITDVMPPMSESERKEAEADVGPSVQGIGFKWTSLA